jgi:carboxylesterase type B
MKDLRIKTMVGDLTQEFQIYKNVFPPSSYEGLIDRLTWDYPHGIAKTVCEKYKPDPASPNPSTEYWIEVFGKLYADLQIHSTMRGFITAISSHVPLHNIYRYRIDWRTKSVDKRIPKELGATHGTDMSIWFFGNGDFLTEKEKGLLREWLKPMVAFINGNDAHWGTRSIRDVRYLTSNGKIEVREDTIFEEKLELWDLTKKVTSSKDSSRQSKI